MSGSAVTGTPSVRSLERCVTEIASKLTASMGSQEEQIVPYPVLTSPEEFMRAPGGGTARTGISKRCKVLSAIKQKRTAFLRLSWSSI